MLLWNRCQSSSFQCCWYNTSTKRIINNAENSWDTKSQKQDLNKLVGRGSSTQVVAFIRDTSLVSSSESIWEKVVNNVPWKQDGQTVEDKMGAT